MTTEALVFLGELDPDAIGPSLEFATHYEPTPVAQANALLDASPLAPERAIFVDVGAGMGRVVMLAARRAFRAVIGVEISPALAEIARENFATLHDAKRVVRDVKIVRADAAEYTLPRGDLVVFMYNPFHGPVLDAVIGRLRVLPDRDVVLLYHTPVDRAAIDTTNAFDLVADLGFGLAYRLRRWSVCGALHPSARTARR